MGVRIRFEHYLERWRNKIGIPFQADEIRINPNNVNNSCSHECHPSCSPSGDMTSYNHVDLQTKDPNCSSENTAINSPHSLTDNEMSRADIEDPSLGHARNMLRRKTEIDRQTTSESEEGNMNATQVLNTVLIAKEDSINNNNNNNSISSRNNYTKCPYSLPQILQMSGSRGINIIKYYEEHKVFTNTQRAQLLQVICDFFEDNDYHLSLNMSHALEAEILQMFPTEKMQYYRTEKRGKLYVKFTNMKRQRKDRSRYSVGGRLNHTPNRDDSRITIRNMREKSPNKSGHNMDTASSDTWPEAAEADVIIKMENACESEVGD